MVPVSMRWDGTVAVLSLWSQSGWREGLDMVKIICSRVGARPLKDGMVGFVVNGNGPHHVKNIHVDLIFASVSRSHRCREEPGCDRQ